MSKYVTNAFISESFMPWLNDRNTFKYQLLYYDEFYGFGDIDIIPYKEADEHFKSQEKKINNEYQTESIKIKKDIKTLKKLIKTLENKKTQKQNKDTIQNSKYILSNLKDKLKLITDKRDLSLSIQTNNRAMFSFKPPKKELTIPEDASGISLCLFEDDFDAYEQFTPYYKNLYKTNHKGLRGFLDRFKETKNSLSESGNIIPFSIDAMDICSQFFFNDPSCWHSGSLAQRDWVMTPFHSVIWGIIINHHLNCDTIFTGNDLDIITTLSFAKWDCKDLLNGAEDYRESIYNYLSKKSKTTIDQKIMVASTVAPQLDQVPYSEILKLKSSKSFKPLTIYLQELSEKNLSQEDMFKYMLNELWKISYELSPSITELVVGAAGNIPVGLVANPIGIMSSLHQGKKHLKFQKEYSWYFILRGIKELKGKVEF